MKHMVNATVFTRNQTSPNLTDATNSILEQAFWLESQKQALSHQQYKHVLDSIDWSLKESKIYLKVAAIFSSFSPDDLKQVEPNTIFELARHAKKYNQVIEKLKDCGRITQDKVRELIAAHRKPKKPKPDKPTIWKTGRDGQLVCRIPDIMEEDMQTGNIIQEEMDENGTVVQTIIREAVLLWQALKSGKIVIKDVKDVEESPQNININCDGKIEQKYSIDVIQNSEEIDSTATEYNQQTILNIPQIQADWDGKLYLEQILEALKQVNSWSEVINIINHYPKQTKSYIWSLLDTGTQNRFHELKRQHIENMTQIPQVNDKVMWDNCPGNVYSWQPFVITNIEDGRAMLDVFDRPVPLDELTKCRE